MPRVTVTQVGIERIEVLRGLRYEDRECGGRVKLYANNPATILLFQTLGLAHGRKHLSEVAAVIKIKSQLM